MLKLIAITIKYEERRYSQTLSDYCRTYQLTLAICGDYVGSGSAQLVLIVVENHPCIDVRGVL